MINVILCGGSGTRLWPLSRKLYPKQFVPLLDEGSLFQLTVSRNYALCDKLCVVTNKDLHFMAHDQISELERNGGLSIERSYLLEPVGRNTAPAIALACFALAEDEVVLVTPSDHLIENTDEYKKRVKIAEELAKQGKMVTFGMTPQYPETGYGYIEASKSDELLDASFSVHAFKEKPDEQTAQGYIEQGNYFWNSGMFVFRAGDFLRELEKHSPEIYEKSKVAFDAIETRRISNRECYFIDAVKMSDIPSNSIDYAVMEKTENAAVVVSDFAWNDLGSFDALYDAKRKDDAGNTEADNLINVGSQNNLISTSGRKTALVGVDNLIVIDTEDALMIAKRGSSQDVKTVVNKLKAGSAKDKELAEVHTTAHRPWGTYTVLEDKEKFKIKRIMVKPGRRLSLQKHMHRSEHWVVVSGTATVQVGEEEKLVRRNESIYIKIGELHRLANYGKIPLHIIETQVGEYVGEDDIIRIEDDYKRGDA